MKKRVLCESSIKHLLIGGVLLLAIPHYGHADFKKFKKKTRFNVGSKQAPKPSQFSDDDNNSKTFGKRTPRLKPAKNSKYVQLNFETGFGPDIVTSFDFPDTDILDLTKHMQKLTGMNLILGKDVKGKVSITAPTPITVGDAWKAYLAALSMANFTIVKSGAFYKIINARDVRYIPTKIYTGSYTPETEAHIMKIMALKNVDANEISRNFRPFMSRYGRIIDIKQTNTIIISDTGANIARLEKLIKFLDVPGHEETLQIIKVYNSSAQEIAKLLDEILKASGSKSRSRSSKSKRFSKSSRGGGSNNISKIIAEPRTNSIIAMANADGAKELRSLIKKLDVKFSSSGSGKIHVHYLDYGSAEDLAKTLSTLVSGSKATNSKNSRSFISRNSSKGLFNGEVKITADKNNNALVVTAAPTDWLTIKNVISKLDIPRDQVYVEGLIMETNVKKVRGFGIQLLGAYASGAANRGGFQGGEGSDIVKLLSGNPQSVGGFFAGFGSGGSRTIKVGSTDVKVNSINGLIKAVASNDNTNVLATPQLMVMDNVEAEFSVGRTVPVTTQTTATNGSTSNSQTNQEAKLSLKITPQINKVTRMIKLKISQSINDFVGEKSATGGQETTTRDLVTEIIVKDRDTIAMGGLLRDRETTSFNKIPLLGDIPVLGWLFKSKQKQIDKVNLLYFLTPRIISPYEKTASTHSLAVLEKRTENLKNTIDDENPDPFGKEVSELSEKLKKQKEGPLYDHLENQFKNSNNSNEGIGPSDEEKHAPNYKKIMNDINNERS